MFIKLGNNHNISLLVTDINGTRITDDSPYTIIKKVGANTYWSGISWVDYEFEIFLDHVMDGVYQYIFTPDTADLYEIVTESDEYKISKTETIEVYADDFVSYKWMVGTEFLIKYPSANSEIIPNVRICKEKDQKYWDGSGWVIVSTYIPMVIIEGGIATYSFIPDEEGRYYITISDGSDELLMSIDATLVADNIPPVIVTNMTMKSLDGTDSTLMTESSIPIAGVKISAYDPVTKQLISQTASDSSGWWSMILKPGKYYFVFEKDGYTPIGMQRTVN